MGGMEESKGSYSETRRRVKSLYPFFLLISPECKKENRLNSPKFAPSADFLVDRAEEGIKI